MKPLTVYKAGAGSGKTFTLAVKYISLLIEDPNSYRTILAVTFTNKATEEMKQRILSQLYGIWRELPSSQIYAEKVLEALESNGLPNVSKSFISNQAGIALRNLLHDYNYFQVQTIDSFFQSVMRNLARELDLTANLRISINDEDVKDRAVDELINSLQANDKVMVWIMSFIKDRINEYKTWNAIKDIKSFAKNIYNNDKYKEEKNKLSAFFEDDKNIVFYKKELEQLANNAISKIKEGAQSFLKIVEDNGLGVDDFKQKKSGIYGYFYKISQGIYDDKIVNSYVRAALEAPENWVSKKNTTAIPLIETTLYPILLKTEETRTTNIETINSVQLTLKNINLLRLLNNIDEKIKEINKENYQFLLSDTQHLLKALIEPTDSPFVFEKIGVNLRHIMIDEFQDTSTIQWKNFKTLLDECLAKEASKSLIVGDVKQSIYRWRSGDWKLLNEIESIFNDKILNVERMQNNYRSERNIIDFNNIFFQKACEEEYRKFILENTDTEELAKSLLMAYDDVKQIPKSKEKVGRVCIELYSDKAIKDEDIDYNTFICERVAKEIEMLILNGAKQENIAVLARKNQILTEIADYLTKNLPTITIDSKSVDVNIVSNEAFKLSSSVAVSTIICAIKLLLHPENKLLQAEAVKAYNVRIKGLSISEEDLLLRDDLTELLPLGFVERRSTLVALPIFDMIEEIFTVFELSTLKDESAYLCTFYDNINELLNEMPLSPQAIIKEWDEHLNEIKIQGDAVSGITLLTIHKSKGLEFDHVIIPHCDWKLERNDYLWCTPEINPYNKLNLIPVSFKKEVTSSIYKQDYVYEHLQNIVDNLNLLYVGFTRAGKSLTVLAKCKEAGKNTNANINRNVLIQDILKNIANNLGEEAIYEERPTIREGINDIFFSYGELVVAKDEITKTKSDNKFDEKPKVITIDIENHLLHTEFLQSGKSENFIHSDEEKSEREKYIELGSILHNIFAEIQTLKDIPQVLNNLEQEGIINDSRIDKNKIIDLIESRLEDDRIKEWFSPNNEVFNECSIMSIDPETGKAKTHRPDRVIKNNGALIVIDFKFGNHKEDYVSQVHTYISLLKEMCNEDVRGFLWYVYRNEIIEVE